MKHFFKLLLMLIIFVGVIATQYFFDVSRKRTMAPQPNVWSAEITKASNLGLNNASADMAWLSMIQYFGGGRSDSYEKLDDYIKLANDLDPKFSYPYAFGTLILPGEGMTDEAIKIGERGVTKSTPDWRIPYYMAITYFSKLNDNASAIKYFDIASKTEGAPSGVKIVTANFGTKPDQREQTKQIWISLYETSNDEVVKQRALAYIEHLNILDLLEQASKIYKEQKGSYPVTTDDLVSAKILKYIPADPLGLTPYLDEQGRARVKE